MAVGGDIHIGAYTFELKKKKISEENLFEFFGAGEPFLQLEFYNLAKKEEKKKDVAWRWRVGLHIKTPVGFNQRPLSNVKSNHEAGRKHSRRTESRRKKKSGMKKGGLPMQESLCPMTEEGQGGLGRGG